MSAYSSDKKTLAFELGEQLSEMTDHYLLMTPRRTRATPKLLPLPRTPRPRHLRQRQEPRRGDAPAPGAILPSSDEGSACHSRPGTGEEDLITATSRIDFSSRRRVGFTTRSPATSKTSDQGRGPDTRGRRAFTMHAAAALASSIYAPQPGAHARQTTAILDPRPIGRSDPQTAARILTICPRTNALTKKALSPRRSGRLAGIAAGS
jgi:hypothetical protein